MGKLIASLLIVLLVASCSVPGNFCDVVGGPLLFVDSTASQVVATDRPTAEAIDVQNQYGYEHCGWKP